MPVSRRQPVGGRVETGQPALEGVDRGRIHQVDLADQQPVGGHHLGQGLAVAIELSRSGHGVHDGDDAVRPESLGDEEVFHQRVQQWHRVGQAGGLDQQPADRRDLAAQAAHEEILEGAGQFAAHGTAQATRVEQHHPLGLDLDQVVIDADLAEFVDQHHRATQPRLAQQVVQHRGLAGTEKAAEHADRNPAVRGTIGGHVVDRLWMAHDAAPF